MTATLAASDQPLATDGHRLPGSLEPTLMPSNGRPLEGAAKASYLAKCEADDSFSAPPSRG